MKAIIVGAGGTARELLRGLADHWDITVIDQDEDRLELATKVREIEFIVGDGSSRVVLERAGIAQAGALMATSNDDSVNLEACRIAIDVGVHQIAAVARDPERLDDYRDLGVPAFSRARLTARRIEMQIEPRRVTSAAFADGLAEAIEFKMSPDSPVVNRPLSDLHLERWVVAAVLRDGTLIVPHGDTILRSGDLVTVVGAASGYSDIVDLFTSGQARFPLDVGKKIVTVAERHSDIDGHVAEAAALVHASAAESLVVIHEDQTTTADELHAAEIEAMVREVAGLAQGFEVRTRAVEGSPGKALARVATEEGAGIIVMPSTQRTDQRSRTRPFAVLAMLRATGIPVLVAAGTQPYRRILVPARASSASEAAARAAIDLAVFGSAVLQAVAVLPPAFLSSAETPNSARAEMGRLREDAAVHGLSIEEHIVEGNPVHQIVDLSANADLVVLGTGRDRQRGRDIAKLVARRSTVSLLIVPDRT